MIPLRIKLKGFLCYKDEQEISFDGAAVWMLSGLNGSGKSAVFDAVTFALFGHHRGGSQHAQELINKNSDRLDVEFDFLQDGQAYRARRTVQRKTAGPAGTQQIFRRHGGGNGRAAWEPVEGTHRKDVFAAWVRDNIGLSYDTFTSSVLLLQGKAERLLDSTAKGRFEVLAGIVDLERYERLHRLADDQRRERDGNVKRLKDRREVLPAVPALELIEAENQIAAADQAHRQSQQEIERLQGISLQARHWADLQGLLAAANARWQQAQRLLADAPAIERDLDRLEELRLVLPHLQNAVDQRNQIQDAERRAGDLARQKEKVDEQLLRQDGALEQVRQKRAALERRLLEEQEQHHRALEGLHQSTLLLSRLEECERQEGELARLDRELAQLPADPEADLLGVREQTGQLEALAAAVDPLAELHGRREKIRATLVRERDALAAKNAIEARGKELASRLAGLQAKLTEAVRLREQADADATRARTLVDEARRQLRELVEMTGAKVCRHCGQGLTAGHLEEEKARRQKLLAQAQADFKEAEAGQKTAALAEQQTRTRLGAVQDEHAAAREQFTEQRHQAEQARKEVLHLEEECGRTWQRLAEPFRSRVAAAVPADWTRTSYPDEEELEALRRQAAGLGRARQRLVQAEEVLQICRQHKAQQDAMRQTLERMRAGLPEDRTALRRTHVRLKAEEQACQRSQNASRAELLETQKDIDRLGCEREQTQQQRMALQGQLQTEEARRQHCRQALDRALKLLPAGWRQPAEAAGLTELNRWSAERHTLEEQQVEQRGRQLREARLGLEVLRQELDRLQAQIADVPGEARQEPAHIEALLVQARQAHRARDDELSLARQRHARLADQRKEREKVEGELREAERELKHHDLLAKLLGRDRLQLHLVRRAERQVVDHANAVLDRLSGGELFLRLVGEAGGEGNTAKALELEAHNRATGEKPINVAFLSGSQKFRVAVSLALGIGQYASRQHRPLESVIIDEGFGCLDRNGRQVMIQELQNLRSQLRCILLVSHQEEFAEAFADGYRFELQEGTTVARRFSTRL